MALGRQRGEKQEAIWVEAWKLTSGPAHPFYGQLEELLTKNGFDRFVEDLCAKFYAPKMGRPGVIPGVYFRMLFIGYFEGFTSEREIAWRCSDSLSLRRFLDVPFEKNTPDHSSLSRTRQRIDLETHADVFSWVLKLVAEHGLVTGKTIGVDGTTLEANAALRAIVRRDTEQGYREFLEDLVKESGIETPTRADIAKADKKRAGKGSNDDWKHPHDGDAGIMKMKDGRTHLSHKAEHSVDLDSGAVLAVTLHRGEAGDTYSIGPTLEQTTEQLKKLEDDGAIDAHGTRELVTDKGYYSNDTLVDAKNAGWRTYCSEPKKRNRHWANKREARDATYANRRRVRGERGKRLLRKRGELLERPFAHYLDSGGMRKTFLRTHPKIMKRLVVHVAGFNLGLVLRKILGHGTPRQLAAAKRSILRYLRVTFTMIADAARSLFDSRSARDQVRGTRPRARWSLRMASATGS